jgi:ABC-type lipoprotein release transport system permease subunit
VAPGTAATNFVVDLAGGDPGRAALADLEGAYGPELSGPVQQPAVRNLDRLRAVPWVLAGIVAAFAAGSLAHALLLLVRRHRRQLAVLKTLGFDRRQVFATIVWQATTLAAIGLVVGLPLGVAVGRWTWTLFAEQIGVVPEPVTPLPLILLVVPAAVLLANLVAAFPAWSAARMRAAAVLRAE